MRCHQVPAGRPVQVGSVREGRLTQKGLTTHRHNKNRGSCGTVAESVGQMGGTVWR